jgi:hypothetical protein
MITTHTHRNARSGLILADWITLGAIFLVVLVVSFPRLHSLALHQNEKDAMQAARMLGNSVLAMERELPLALALEEDASLAHRLEDVEVLEQGRLLRRHGYLFDLKRGVDGTLAIRAWPWNAGETGYGAFLYTKEEGLVGHANSHARWSGPDRAPTLEARDTSWQRVTP